MIKPKEIKNKDEQEKRNLFVNPGINTMFVDNVSIATRKDNKLLLSFQQNIPQDMNLECARVLVDNSHAKQIIDLLCKNLDYYPTKDEVEKK